MATPSNNVIREYHNDESFLTGFGSNTDVTEYQLCLAFATDSGEGRFIPAWNIEEVTPNLIKKFKADCAASNLPVKVFVSIGGNHPFKVVGGADDWILNATTTLHQMISEYHIDGIDVNYTTIECNKDMFVNCIQNLIKGLREALGTTGFVASLATDAATNEGFYLPLYQAIDKTWIETVVFECFVDVQPQDTNNPVASLVTQVQKIVQQYNPKDTKVLLGYSAIKDDWNKVSPPNRSLVPSRKGYSVIKGDWNKGLPPFVSLARVEKKKGSLA